MGRRGRSRQPRLLRVPRIPGHGGRCPPRGHAADVQGDGRGALPGRVGEGRLRDRDALARHQHAGQERRDRGPLEVPGRTARARHTGGVHAAHRPGGPERDRRSRPRGRHLSAAGAVRACGRARRHPDLRPRLIVPALVQHGGQPGSQLHPRTSAPSPELVVRPVPRRPWCGGARAIPPAGSRRTRGLPEEHGVSPRRLRGVLGLPREGASAPRRRPKGARSGSTRGRPGERRAPSAGRRRLGAACATPRGRGGGVVPRRETDRARPRSPVLPPERPRLRGATAGPDEDPPAEDPAASGTRASAGTWPPGWWRST